MRQKEKKLFVVFTKKVIRSLYKLFSEEPNLMPPDYRCKEKRLQPRFVTDFIAGMMDTFAIEQYEKYFNEKFDQIVLK